MSDYTLIDSTPVKWIAFLATVTSATILLYLLANLRRTFRWPYGLSNFFNPKEYFIVRAYSRSNPANRLISDFDYLLRRLDIRADSLPIGTLHRIAPGALVSVSQFSSIIENYFDPALTNTATWSNKLKELENVFDFEMPFAEAASRKISIRCFDQLELHLISTALIYSTRCNFAAELVGELGTIATNHLVRQTGKPVSEFNAQDTEWLASILSLYLPPDSQAEFLNGVSYVLPSPKKPLTWDEHKFVVDYFINTWRKHHG